MTEHNHFLLIPPTGLLEVTEVENRFDFDKKIALSARGAEGHSVSLVIESNGDHVCRVDWMVSSLALVNSRARRAVSHLGDMHMIFTGPVLISECEWDRLSGIVALLSVEGS